MSMLLSQFVSHQTKLDDLRINLQFIILIFSERECINNYYNNQVLINIFQDKNCRTRSISHACPLWWPWRHYAEFKMQFAIFIYFTLTAEMESRYCHPIWQMRKQSLSKTKWFSNQYWDLNTAAHLAQSLGFSSCKLPVMSYRNRVILLKIDKGVCYSHVLSPSVFVSLYCK